MGGRFALIKEWHKHDGNREALCLANHNVGLV
jgi:hypothetical protein